MHKNIKTALTITAAVTGVAVAVKSRQSYNNDLYERFPDLDRKIVRQAFSKMMLKALTNQYTDDMQHWSDTKMDELFMIEYNKIADKK